METNTSLPSNDRLNEHPDYSGLTGIPLVDEQLTKATPNGGVIVVTAPTGAGKSVLAGQIAARYAMACRHVILVSTEMEPQAYYERMMACLTEWPIDKLYDGRMDIIPLADGQAYRAEDIDQNSEFAARSIDYMTRLAKSVTVEFRPSFRERPTVELEEILAGIDESVSCLVLDQLYIDGLETSSNGKPKTRNVTAIATRVMDRLGQFARERQIPIFVFCQCLPNSQFRIRKQILPQFIAEFRSIASHCDCFVGISQRIAQARDLVDRERTYSANQYFTVLPKGSDPTCVPVYTEDFLYQRFVAREKDDSVWQCELKKRAREIMARSTNRGYVQARRDQIRKVMELGGSALNVYTFALLVAKYQEGKDRGTFYRGEENIALALGLKRGAVRKALKKLEEHGFLKQIGKNHRANVREVCNYDELQDANVPGYFILARNLRDDAQRELRGDPERFRVWIALLSLANFADDPEGMLSRGQWRPDTAGLASMLHMKPAAVEDVLESFFRDGLIEVVTVTTIYGPEDLVQIADYDVYQSAHVH